MPARRGCRAASHHVGVTTDWSFKPAPPVLGPSSEQVSQSSQECSSSSCQKLGDLNGHPDNTLFTGMGMPERSTETSSGYVRKYNEERFPALLFPRCFPGQSWKQLKPSETSGSCGGRTRARTWDPLIKSLQFSLYTPTHIPSKPSIIGSVREDWRHHSPLLRSTMVAILVASCT
jgi:hypothetical protein